jgi:hypothetical protein
MSQQGAANASSASQRAPPNAASSKGSNTVYGGGLQSAASVPLVSVTSAAAAATVSVSNSSSSSSSRTKSSRAHTKVKRGASGQAQELMQQQSTLTSALDNNNQVNLASFSDTSNGLASSTSTMETSSSQFASYLPSRLNALTPKRLLFASFAVLHDKLASVRPYFSICRCIG